MPKTKFSEDDLFQRGQLLRARHAGSTRDLELEAASARASDYLEALVAAVAVIAHADGRLDLNERRKLVEAFLASPAFTGYSVVDLAEELALHMRAYGYDPQVAQDRALESLALLDLTTSEKTAIRDICHKVIIADGLVHPVELGALGRIERVFGLDDDSLSTSGKGGER